MERTNSRKRKPGVAKPDEYVRHDVQLPETSLRSSNKHGAPVVLVWPWEFTLAHLVYIALVVVLLGLFLLSQLDVTPWMIEGTGNVIWGPGQLDDNDGSEEIGIVLHPEDYTNRSPTTLVYDWEVTKRYRFPDGVRKEVYLINNRFPGETIEARSGDRIVVNVTNLLQNEGLAIHWHGLRMQGANDMDGAVGVTQKPVPPGESFLYNFTIGEEEFGTFWYHGHDKVQRDDGLYGGLVVHRPGEQGNEKDQYNYDQEILLLIGDWYHRSSPEVLGWYMNSRSFGSEPVPDSVLVNGQGNFDCEMAVPARPLECIPPEDRSGPPMLTIENGKRYRLRLVNTGSLTGFSFRMDNASLSPFQVDGGNDITMAQTQAMGIVYPGERVDTILQTGSPDDQRCFEVEMDDENFKYPNPALNPRQTFPVKARSNLGYDKDIARPELEFYNLQAAVSTISPWRPWPNDPLKFVIYTTTLKLAKHHNIPMGFINHTSWSPQASPPEPLISLSRKEFDHNQLSPQIPLLTNRTEDEASGGWVDIIINNLDDGGHPFHLHGYSFYVVSIFPPPPPWSSEKPPFTPGGSAMYNYNPFTTTPQDSPAGQYNLVNPVMKDTVFVPQRGYAVIRFRADNPGIWMMHCHVGWHLGSGMALSWDIG
ncbi:uncharacterized protein Z518_00171 [Rhinocladiella mackenziei CBS 650.93]|uniref:Laccase n=1 Tax=Rhinocladiella mackenziei CBS 650.93 TaxID=1442369 RepID=A0A0D2HEP6_9EURO|nr:uncharacterized protein Z518_00171 [Rhinocladiella mackenziei CBS 650.93]KIX09093.1 hypothetical protein Z518_00171 [Rhinocladiella mackenziei CBS 650.93]